MGRFTNHNTKGFCYFPFSYRLRLCQAFSVNNVWLRYDSGFNDPVGVLQGCCNLQHIRCPAERMFLFEMEEL